MTDTNHIAVQLAEAVERLAFQMPAPNPWTPQFVQLATTAKVAALSARASAGEGGGVPCPTCGAPCTVAHVKSGNAAYREYAYAAPQPAQTQGEGNDELFGEVRFPAKGSPWGYGA